MRDRRLRLQEQRLQELQAARQEEQDNMAGNVVMSAQQFADFLQQQQDQMQQMMEAVIGAIPQP